MLESIEYCLKERPKRISWPTSAFAISLLFSFFLSGLVKCKFSFEYGYAEQNLIKIIGRTAKSVTELLSFLGTIYGGGFVRIPTDSYSDVTFFLREERRGYQVSYFALDVKLTKWQKVIVT